MFPWMRFPVITPPLVPSISISSNVAALFLKIYQVVPTLLEKDVDKAEDPMRTRVLNYEGFDHEAFHAWHAPSIHVIAQMSQ